ncbi:hypothetical protein [Sporosarcina sp. A2]|uniref:hypothetical protein n=1 Tax=Sporosarcina sp. A2 TaxID=3393449 RepID=UPI003D7BD597
MIFSSVLFSIITWAIGLYILYFIITAAVKNGINQSVIGRSFEDKSEPVPEKKSFLDSDLDNDK